jgi:hypothetical protein
MAKRQTGLSPFKKKVRPRKTKKRLAVKKAMLSSRKKKK